MNPTHPNLTDTLKPRDVYLLIKPRESIRDFHVKTPLAFGEGGGLSEAR